MSDFDFYRTAPARTMRVKGVEREPAIRLYCEQSGATWNLQVRAALGLRNGREGKDFIVATASLNEQDLIALRDAIEHLLEEAAKAGV